MATGAFGAIIQSGSRGALLSGYAVGAAFMLSAAVVSARLGVAAEGCSLEELTGPAAATPDEHQNPVEASR